MPQNTKERWISLLSFGFFIMLFALFFLLVPNYTDEISAFIKDFTMEEVAPNVNFPTPQDMYEHSLVYETVMRFCIVFGLFQCFIVGLRLYLKSTLKKTAESVSNVVLWLGWGFVFSLLVAETVDWIPFIGGLVAIIGLSLIARSLVVLTFWRMVS